MKLGDVLQMNRTGYDKVELGDVLQMNRTGYDKAVAATATAVTYPRRHPLRGFWLKTRRLPVPRPRFRRFYWLRFMRKWKLPYYRRALKVLKRGFLITFSIHRRCSNKINVNDDHQSPKRRMAMSGDSNGGSGTTNYASSFYSDAIKDCLEYIKMSAISRDDEKCIGRG